MKKQEKKYGVRYYPCPQILEPQKFIPPQDLEEID